MEAELIRHLMLLLDRYRAAARYEESTVGRLCAADTSFFSRLREGKTLTARKYDQVVAWFSANWPPEAEWPSDVMRPPPDASPEAAA